MFNCITTLLLDMNNTFMFGEDRFEKNTNYSQYYREIGGNLSSSILNSTINGALEYLGERYLRKEYHNNFPTLEEAIKKSSALTFATKEIEKIISTLAFYEHGHIPKNIQLH